MSLLGQLRYRANVDLLGRAALGFERLRLEHKLKKAVASWKHPHLSPPLSSSPWLKQLIFTHYLKGRFAGDRGPVAWVTSGAPVELLTALGFYVLYPENHAAVCAIRRTAERMCMVAESKGFSQDICSYARTDFGSLLSGQTPVGRLPRPDLLLCCTNICQTVLYWYQVLAHHFGVPLVLIDTPFLYGEAPDHAIAYVKRQMELAVEPAERVAKKSLSMKALREVTVKSKEAVGLWLAVLETAKHRPAPITAFDEFIHMAPIVEMRGEGFTVEYYRALLAELEDRARRGVGALQKEQKRVVWDNLPVWSRIRWLAERLAERGVALVASTYTQAWGELAALIDPDQAFESAARVYLHVILNQGSGHKLEVIEQMVAGYKADGVILHSDRSCKPYSIGQLDQKERILRQAKVPALLLEADHNDPRAFSEEQVENRLGAFMEVLGV